MFPAPARRSPQLLQLGDQRVQLARRPRALQRVGGRLEVGPDQVPCPRADELLRALRAAVEVDAVAATQLRGHDLADERADAVEEVERVRAAAGEAAGEALELEDARLGLDPRRDQPVESRRP